MPKKIADWRIQALFDIVACIKTDILCEYDEMQGTDQDVNESLKAIDSIENEIALWL